MPAMPSQHDLNLCNTEIEDIEDITSSFQSVDSRPPKRNIVPRARKSKTLLNKSDDKIVYNGQSDTGFLETTVRDSYVPGMYGTKITLKRNVGQHK